VVYTVQPLNPVSADQNWIMTEIEAIPVGNDYGLCTTASAIDPIIEVNVKCWLTSSLGDGEDTQHQRNDGLLKFIMALAGIPINCFSRNTAAGGTMTVNPLQRPDFVAHVKGVGILIVEEKDGNDAQSAKDDIVNKFGWIPHIQNLPFFIGIAICASTIEILEISHQKVFRTLFFGACSSTDERLQCLVPAVNIARVLKYWITNNFIESMSLSMGKWHQRPCGKSIRIGFHGVDIIYSKREDYLRLKDFYNKCNNIPYLERLVNSYDKSRRMLLTPIGVNRQPASFDEFFHAVECICYAVNAIHRLGYYHTDIRWANIVHVPANNSWVLIDCFDVIPRSNDKLCKQRIVERQIEGSRIWNDKHDIDCIVRLFNIYNNYEGEIPEKILNLKDKLQELTTLKNIRRILLYK
jgi:hypothetical protein